MILIFLLSPVRPRLKDVLGVTTPLTLAIDSFLAGLLLSCFSELRKFSKACAFFGVLLCLRLGILL